MQRYPRFWAILAGVVLVAGACGGGDDDGGGDDAAAGAGTGEESTKDPITVGAVFDLSGPTSDVGTPYAQGIKDYVDHLNNEGGLDGAEVKLLSQDYEYKVPNAEQLYSQYIAEGATAFIGWGTADTEALRPRVNADKIPYISASFSESVSDPAETPYNFFPGPSYSDQMRAVLKHIGETEGDAQTEVAVFYNDSPFGKSPLEDGQKYIDDKKLKISYKTYAMRAGATDYTAELTQAKNAKWIIVQNVPGPAAKLLEGAEAAGLEAQVVCLNYCGDELLVKLAGPAAEGVMAAMPFAPPEAAEAGSLKEIEDYLAAEKKTMPAPQLRYVQGWYTAKVFLEGLGAAEGAKPDKDALKAGLETISDFKTGVGPTITFTADDHSGMDGVALYKVEGGKWAKATDEIEP